MELIESPGYPHTVGLQVSAWLSASSPTEARHWSPITRYQRYAAALGAAHVPVVGGPSWRLT